LTKQFTTTHKLFFDKPRPLQIQLVGKNGSLQPVMQTTKNVTVSSAVGRWSTAASFDW